MPSAKEAVDCAKTTGWILTKFGRMGMDWERTNSVLVQIQIRLQMFITLLNIAFSLPRCRLHYKIHNIISIFFFFLTYSTARCVSSTSVPLPFVKLPRIEYTLHAQTGHECQIKTKPLLMGVATQMKAGKKFVTQLNWALILSHLWLELYPCPSLSVSLFSPLCLTFLCSVSCKRIPNATVSGIGGKVNLAHIVLARTASVHKKWLWMFWSSPRIAAKMSNFNNRKTQHSDQCQTINVNRKYAIHVTL